MNVELKPHIGVLPSGKKVEHRQWMVFADGEHVGYLDHQCEFPLMPVARLIGQPYSVIKEIVDQCSKLTKKTVALPKDVYIPPQLHTESSEYDQS